MPRNIVVVCLQVLRQVIDCAALADTVSDENNFVRRQEILCYFFVKCFVFRYPLALVVCFLLVNQVMMEAKRIVWMHGVFGLRHFLVNILVHVRNMMINHHNHPAGLRWLSGRKGWACLTEEFSQPRYFFDA
jgi:hypothetical protein